MTIVSSSALSSLIMFLINRKDNKEKELKLIIKKLDKLELDSTRTQLLFLLSSGDSNVSETLTVAEHYFSDLNGDWYMSAMFENWLDKHKLNIPQWYHNK